ncbi:hypothetical protein TNCV_4381841 [Trichonephila clavipes]|nr:hypothetical protein TNCV_4381841 [Trichonephila clavipes]
MGVKMLVGMVQMKTTPSPETGSMTRSSAPYLETTILLVLLAWLVGGGVASLRQGPMGWLALAIGIEHCYWL